MKAPLGFALASLLLAACASQSGAPSASPSNSPAPPLGAPPVPESSASLPWIPTTALPPPPAPAPPRALELKDHYEALVAKESDLEFLRKPGLTVDEEKNHYRRVKTPELRGGHVAFALFRGDGHDLVVQELKSCGTGCTYSYVAYDFTGPQYSRILFSSALPTEEIFGRVKKMIPRKRRGGKPVPNWPRAEHLRLVLGGAIEQGIPLYALRELSARKREDVTYYDVGKLQWNAKEFRFSFEPRAKAKSLGKLDAY